MNAGNPNRSCRRLCLVGGAALLLLGGAWHDIEAAEGFPPQTFTFPVQAWIPDGDDSGLADARSLPAGPAPILSLVVTLQLSPHPEGAFLGDLFVSLAGPTAGYSVLLNRPGRAPGRPFGYSDGMNVHITLSDAASADVHNYRLTLTGDENIPLNIPLTGLWQPDARATDPADVVTDDPRTAGLGSFAGLEPGGTWVLFAADVSGGGQYRLDAWSLEVHYIPEPSTAGLLIMALLVGSARMVRGRFLHPGANALSAMPSPGPFR
ncbi:PEP-CTERM sorting domain-containing protein [Limisphaera sp. VF-2]|uniref:PEP-CTERM sorting domain-containing protein n=1 Tax=Limisphaera sp. VF-2 TaxID=3400418 RepID=UPI001778421D